MEVQKEKLIAKLKAAPGSVDILTNISTSMLMLRPKPAHAAAERSQLMPDTRVVIKALAVE